MKSVVVASGKGGVGKTTVATAIARSIAMKGIKTGLIDLDVDSPSIPMITGTTGNDIGMGGSLLEPANSNGLKVFSIGHLLPSDDTPILWEGGRKERVLMDIFKSCDFRDVECLVVDLPPGTGDELYGVTKVLPSATAIVVTMPQQLSLISVKKALKALERYNILVLGIVENMSGLKCSKCGEVMYPFKQGAGKMVADTNGVEYLGAIPIMMNISREADEGSVDTIVNSTEFKSIADKIIQKLGLFPETFTPITEGREKDEGKEIRTEEKEGGKESEEKREGKVTVKKEIEKKRKGVGRITATVKRQEEKGKKEKKEEPEIIRGRVIEKEATVRGKGKKSKVKEERQSPP